MINLSSNSGSLKLLEALKTLPIHNGTRIILIIVSPSSRLSVSLVTSTVSFPSTILSNFLTLCALRISFLVASLLNKVFEFNSVDVSDLLNFFKIYFI